MNKRIIIVSIVIIITGAVLCFFMMRNKTSTPMWKTTKVERGDVNINVTATGSLNAVTTVQVGAQVSGIVAKILVDYDSVVKKGQVIAVLDTVLLYATMKDAAASVEKSRVQVDLMKRQFIRADTLFKEHVAAQSDYDLAYANYRSAQADLNMAIATLSHEMTNLRYATIHAPIDGTVISRNVDVGQTVISSFNAPTLFTIAQDLTQMQVLADVDEADIGQVKVGQKTEFTVDAYPYEIFKGDVAQIRLQPTMIQNVNNYVVVINVPNPDLKLLPGLTATTTIKTQQHKNVLVVPISALHFIPAINYLSANHFPDTLYTAMQKTKVAGNEIPKPGSNHYIWVKKNDAISPVFISSGLFDGTNIEISGDIKEGDEVIIGTSTAPQGSTVPATNNPFMPKMNQSAPKK